MADATDEVAAAGGAAPYLLVGNSYAGAIIAALQRDDDAAAAERIDVAAAGGDNYRQIGIEDGRIVRARLFRERSRPVADYRAIFLYGYLPHPFALATLVNRYRKQRYSQQVARLAIEDAVRLSDSLVLRDRFRAATDAPILLLPGNPAANAPDMTAAERAELEAVVRAHAGDAYLPTPAAFFDADGRPLAGYYKDSVNIMGAVAADPRQDKHDLLHLNVDGGALWLATIVERMDELDRQAAGGGA